MDIDFYLLLRRSHIFVGMLGLFVYWIPIFAKKGGKAHIIAGRIFEWCGYYVASTALFTCVRYLVTPRHYAFFTPTERTAEELARIEFPQFFLTMLAFLAFIFFVQLRTAMRVVRTRKEPVEVYQNWEARFWLYGQVIACVALIGYGVVRLATGGGSVHWLSIVVGAIPLSEFKKERQFYLNPREHKMSWWYKHMDAILGCGVAFHTAGFVFLTRWLGTNRWLELPGALQLVPWVLPALVGVPASYFWIKSYRRKFGDDSATRAVPERSLSGTAD